MAYILGLSNSNHDNAAALVKDGMLVAAAEEERFTRNKHEWHSTSEEAYPKNAVKYCLDSEGIQLKDIDFFAYGWLPIRNQSFRGKISRFSRIKPLVIHKKNNHIYVPHHDAHAASAYRLCCFKKSPIMTLDATGERETIAFFEGCGEKLTRKWEILSKKKNNSFGGVYEAASMLLGFGDEHNAGMDGKLMALASYGNANIDVSSALKIKSRSHAVINSNLQMFSRRFSDYRRERNLPIKRLHENFAASIQKAMCDSVLNLVKNNVPEESKSLCLAGGVALNCKINGAILKQTRIKNIFIQPAANDAGCAVGAAMEASNLIGEKSRHPIKNVYLGPGFSNEEIKEELKKQSINFEYHSDITGTVSELLANGKTVAWFQGRMELGPRALGNRSLLADPRNPRMHDKMNRIKKRELWRPFAPSILDSKAKNWLENYHDSPYMVVSFDVKESKRKDIPAVVHVDGSTRPQAVAKESNPLYYRLIKNFEKETGVPLVLNTSFNSKNEPIVCTPKDAIKSFMGLGADFLAIGGFLAKK